MSSPHDKFPALVEHLNDGYKLEFLFSQVHAPSARVSVPAPRSIVDGGYGLWPGYSFQLLLVASEYCAALQEFLKWSFPPEWDPLKPAVAAHAAHFIHTSAAVPPPVLPPGAPDAARTQAAQAHAVWAAFTHSYFHGGRDLAAFLPASCSTSTSTPSSSESLAKEVKSAIDWLRRLVGDQGWRPGGAVHTAASGWVRQMRRRLEPLFPGLDRLGAREWAASGPGQGCAMRQVEQRRASNKQEARFTPVYPYRVTGGFSCNRIKFKCKSQEAPRDISAVRGRCGVPNEFSQTHNCALGFLVLADVMQAFSEASKRWRGLAPEAEREVIQAFFSSVLSGNGDERPLPAAHAALEYPAYLAGCVLGWELALQQVAVWVEAAAQTAAAAFGYPVAATAAAAAGGGELMRVPTRLLLPRTVVQVPLPLPAAAQALDGGEPLAQQFGAAAAPVLEGTSDHLNQYQQQQQPQTQQHYEQQHHQHQHHQHQHQQHQHQQHQQQQQGYPPLHWAPPPSPLQLPGPLCHPPPPPQPQPHPQPQQAQVQLQQQPLAALRAPGPLVPGALVLPAGAAPLAGPLPGSFSSAGSSTSALSPFAAMRQASNPAIQLPHQLPPHQQQPHQQQPQQPPQQHMAHGAAGSPAVDPTGIHAPSPLPSPPPLPIHPYQQQLPPQQAVPGLRPSAQADVLVPPFGGPLGIPSAASPPLSHPQQAVSPPPPPPPPLPPYPPQQPQEADAAAGPPPAEDVVNSISNMSLDPTIPFGDATLALLAGEVGQDLDVGDKGTAAGARDAAVPAPAAAPGLAPAGPSQPALTTGHFPSASFDYMAVLSQSPPPSRTVTTTTGLASPAFQPAGYGAPASPSPPPMPMLPSPPPPPAQAPAPAPTAPVAPLGAPAAGVSFVAGCPPEARRLVEQLGVAGEGLRQLLAAWGPAASPRLVRLQHTVQAALQAYMQAELEAAGAPQQQQQQQPVAEARSPAVSCPSPGPPSPAIAPADLLAAPVSQVHQHLGGLVPGPLGCGPLGTLVRGAAASSPPTAPAVFVPNPGHPPAAPSVKGETDGGAGAAGPITGPVMGEPWRRPSDAADGMHARAGVALPGLLPGLVPGAFGSARDVGAAASPLAALLPRAHRSEPDPAGGPNGGLRQDGRDQVEAQDGAARLGSAAVGDAAADGRAHGLSEAGPHADGPPAGPSGAGGDSPGTGLSRQQQPGPAGPALHPFAEPQGPEWGARGGEASGHDLDEAAGRARAGTAAGGAGGGGGEGGSRSGSLMGGLGLVLEGDGSLAGGASVMSWTRGGASSLLLDLVQGLGSPMGSLKGLYSPNGGAAPDGALGHEGT